MKIIVHMGKDDFCWMRMGRMLTFHTLPDLQNDLLWELICHNEVVMDFSDVIMVDTSCIKGILAIRQEAERNSKRVHFLSCNKSFLQLLELMNNSPELVLPAD